MLKYSNAKRHFNRQVFIGDADSVHWSSNGTVAAPTPPVAGTHKRLYQNWLFYDGLRTVFVWQNSKHRPPRTDTGSSVISLFAFWVGGGAISPPPAPIPPMVIVPGSEPAIGVTVIIPGVT